MRILFTVPTHNEADAIEYVVGSFLREAHVLGLDASAQVIDDHSSDDTVARVRRMGVPVHELRDEHGLAAAFRLEMQRAIETSADYFVHIDGDGQHRATDLSKFLPAMASGFDLILGNRLHVRPEGMTDIRYDANLLLSRIVGSIIGRPISDSQTGFRAIRRRVAETFTTRGEFTYTQEQIIRAFHHGLALAEVPIAVQERTFGPSRLVKSPVHYLARAFQDIERTVDSLQRDEGVARS